MCKIACALGLCGGKAIQSRLLGLLAVAITLGDLLTFLIYREPTWVIVVRSVFLALQLLACAADFIAIAKGIPQLMFPIISMTIPLFLINCALVILAIISLVDQNSFYGNYLRDNRILKETSDEDAKSLITSYNIVSLIASASSALVF
ncbi:hypothetical protein PENTCL1PPCAC_498, partial [Pristionchus entomophagus]